MGAAPGTHTAAATLRRCLSSLTTPLTRFLDEAGFAKNTWLSTRRMLPAQTGETSTRSNVTGPQLNSMAMPM